MKIAGAALVSALCVCASPAFAKGQQYFNLPAQRLDVALIALGSQASVSIGGVDTRLGTVRSHPVRGTMSTVRALQIMLEGTGFDFTVVDASTFRIIRAAPKRIVSPAKPPKLAASRRTAPEPPSEDLPVRDIIVTGSKQNQPLDRYPGTAHVTNVGGVGMSENLGTAAFVARLPSLTSTNLGPGRNKVFVRGIADSSFTGPTQSTIGLYLGDLRLTYNAPEPDLRLYDIEKVEVIEGPQGTLYGAGALGGIIRIMPNGADVSSTHATLSGGVSTTKSGASGFDLGGMVNIPLIEDRVALRLVGYRQIEGGYITNIVNGGRNINRTRVQGGRATLQIEAGNDWTVDLGGVIQNIDTRDSQYAERNLPLLTRASQIAQPHDNDFRAAHLAVTKKWDRLSLISSTGIVRHDLSDQFDATGYLGQPGVLAYQSSNKIRLITHETRLSRNTERGGSWVSGVSFVSNTDRIQRSLGPVGSLVMLAALRNAKTEIAVFGEATQPVAPDWSATLGARVVHSITIGELPGSVGPEFERKRAQTRVLPTAALSWKPRADLLAWLRVQTGFRSGGIAVSGGQINSAERFDSDEIRTGELGLRLGDTSGTGRGQLSGGISGFYTQWNSIQADVIGTSGLPFTANIGRGRIFGVEANMIWRPTDSLMLDAALFANDSALTTAAPGFEETDTNSLPNIAKIGGRASFAWTQPLSDTINFKLDGTVRYVGSSRLGTSPPLILEQGETVQVDVSAAIGSGDRWQITLDAANIMNVSGNSFSYGNPFTVALGQQITPLRPRTIRLGMKVGF